MVLFALVPRELIVSFLFRVLWLVRSMLTLLLTYDIIFVFFLMARHFAYSLKFYHKKHISCLF